MIPVSFSEGFHSTQSNFCKNSLRTGFSGGENKREIMREKLQGSKLETYKEGRFRIQASLTAALSLTIYCLQPARETQPRSLT